MKLTRSAFHSAQSKLIRFLVPGDIVDSRSVARQIRAAKKFKNQVAVVEVNGRKARVLTPSVPLLAAPFDEQNQPWFSATMFPLSVLSQVGGFDIVLGEAYQARYLFRLMAAGVRGAFIDANGSSLCAMPSGGSADEIAIAAFANLIQCLSNPHLWHHAPDVVRSLRAVTGIAVENRELYSLRTRALDFTINTIGKLSANAANQSPLAAFALCLVGFEWGRRPSDQRTPELETIRSAILDKASGIPLDGVSELLLPHSNPAADPSFTDAIAVVLTALQGQSQYAGLRNVLRRMQPISKRNPM